MTRILPPYTDGISMQVLMQAHSLDKYGEIGPELGRRGFKQPDIRLLTGARGRRKLSARFICFRCDRYFDSGECWIYQSNLGHIGLCGACRDFMRKPSHYKPPLQGGKAGG